MRGTVALSSNCRRIESWCGQWRRRVKCPEIRTAIMIHQKYCLRMHKFPDRNSKDILHVWMWQNCDHDFMVLWIVPSYRRRYRCWLSTGAEVADYSTLFVAWQLSAYRPMCRHKAMLLSRVSMQCVQSAILFYQSCPSLCLSVCPVPVFCLNEWSYRHTFELTIRSKHHSNF